MENRASYTIVGSFVLILTVGIVLFVFWLGKYGFGEKFDYYKVYMTESVSGLSIDASVKYRGVNVGSVSDIKINPKNTKEVEVFLRVKRGTPITKGMLAELKYFGLTGLAYIELTGGYENAPLLKKKNGEIPVLKEKPSLYNRLDTTLTGIMSKISVTIDRIDRLLSDKNIENISKTIQNSEEITKNIRNSNPQISKAIQNFIKIEKNINILTKSLTKTSQDISSSSSAFKNMSITIKKIAKKKIDTLVKQINKTSKKADVLMSNIITSIQAGDYNIKQISSPMLQQIDQITRELQILLQTSQETIEELKNSPSNLLYKKEKPNLGPGEKMP